LLDRFIRTGQPEDLREAFYWHERADYIQETGGPEWISYYLALGEKFLQQFQQTGQVEDLHKALNIYDVILKYARSPLVNTASWAEIIERIEKITILSPDDKGQRSDI
jgi:hypothetical protein